MSADFYAGHDLEALAHLENYSGAILACFAPHVRGRVLEVGAGIGNFAATYLDKVDEALLVEPASNLFGRLDERFAASSRVRCFHGVLDDADPQPGSFDAAVMVNVLEHVRDDAGTLRLLRRALRPDGRLLLFVPALPILYGAMDEEMGHCRRYTRRTLRRTVEDAGFAVERLDYFDVLGMLPWFVVGRVLRRRFVDPAAARLYDRVVVPGLSRLERVVRPPLGKNLVLVARPGA
jgi:SAM-dependent methyltransferase